MTNYATKDDVREIVGEAMDHMAGVIQDFAEAVDKRFDNVDKRFDNVESDIRDIKSDIRDIRREMTMINERLDRLEGEIKAIHEDLKELYVEAKTIKQAKMKLAKLEREQAALRDWARQVSRQTGIALPPLK